MNLYIWVRRPDGSFQGAKVDQAMGEGKEARFAVTYLDEDGVETDELGLVWKQERATSVAIFESLQGLQLFAGLKRIALDPEKR